MKIWNIDQGRNRRLSNIGVGSQYAKNTIRVYALGEDNNPDSHRFCIKKSIKKILFGNENEGPNNR